VRVLYATQMIVSWRQRRTERISEELGVSAAREEEVVRGVEDELSGVAEDDSVVALDVREGADLAVAVRGEDQRDRAR
jgi:division protein CdvB (Snf7/Vps24/ESCRT-III family)